MDLGSTVSAVVPASRHVRLDEPAGRWVLLAAVLGSGVALLDATVVNIALPALGRDLDAGFAALQWTVNAYALTLAALILLGGSLGDRFGRPVGLGTWQVAGGAALSGIGFTISLFIVDLALDDPVLQDQARVGVLAASLIAAAVGWALFRLGDRLRRDDDSGRRRFLPGRSTPIGTTSAARWTPRSRWWSTATSSAPSAIAPPGPSRRFSHTSATGCDTCSAICGSPMSTPTPTSPPRPRRPQLPRTASNPCTTCCSRVPTH